MKTSVKELFSPYRIGRMEMPNRIVMAPMTRCMATDEFVPTAEMAEYYARRAEAGLIVTEGTVIRPDGRGYPNSPGIYTEEQVNGWRDVTGLVNSRGGKLFLQIWHVGRISHPFYINGEPPVAPSAVPLEGKVARADNLEYGTPRALEADEIGDVVEAYAKAAENALSAGFDGVEIHGANGYLIDQFLHHHTNKRTDEYGGTTEKMARFALEVVDAVASVVGAEKTGIRLSPAAYHFIEPAVGDAEVFIFLLKELEKRNPAYVHAGIFDDGVSYDYLGGTVSGFLRKNYRGALIGCGSYTPEKAASAIRNGELDMVAFGRPFIANPDMVSKIRTGEPLKPYDESMLAALY